MSIVSESFRLNTSESTLIGLEYTSTNNTAVGIVDWNPTMWFERGSIHELIAHLRALLHVEQGPASRIQHGNDQLKVYLNGPDPAPLVNLENMRTTGAPHDGFQWVAMSKNLAAQLVEALGAL